MADARQVAAEIKRLSEMSPDAFTDTVVQYVTGGTNRRAPRETQGAALHDPRLAPRTLQALRTAVQRAKAYNPIREGETRKQQQARIAPWRETIKAAMPPFEDVVDDLAHDHAKELAALGDDSFADRWTGFVLDEPVPAPTSPHVEALAFRSPRVAGRVARLCRLMIEEPARFMPEPPAGESGNAQERRVENFRRRVESEAAYLRYSVQYGEARQGRMPSEPNVRLQALKVLGERHPEELMELLRQERGGALEKAAEERRARRAVRRAARQGAR
ncbi:hypothetical protein SAMN05216483_6733 [Streptomyces sp. 2131.1]|uniref:hypothetical protein n=1 Tax=Streptomyces sp. 2131.1 TaxID=1855346 RepID=UPI00089583C2|nr:hypothetical protein [Streptomyces sp. 2131.1]SEE83970.1 hypothetical protein SAMN05216483_6733 [Streptomyces sp. 2131.1]